MLNGIKPSTPQISWSNEPENYAPEISLNVIRVPTAGRLGGIITTSEWTGAWVHWHRGRTVPHTEGVCQACKDNCGLRWVGYLGILNGASEAHAIVEFPRGCLGAIAAQEKNHGSLRGWIIRMQRLTAKPNGRIAITWEPPKTGDRRLPEEPSIQKIMGKIWESGWRDKPREAGVERELEAKVIEPYDQR